ncbi:hypothetical protein FOQG_17976 [Fusarium oxysporum f. sp. raphani 54005]|uniref:Uncharacterized protein n=2 Tax=Fusarium oxysporum f. sp. raphani TaxID=96318 RepID=X0B5C2_FUSOX|nr:hypothetical protein FOQG_17976 [Fusarium oxysporum f. sp. raphani 54005]KAG7425007.1 hypothetical protein Forpi1262_v014151 [Fusarium oxysporum f. sp. raphani]KAJ4094115.1 hypothetical protein NW769_012179 [Fusarium oxysporum]KAJ4215319.1 hypothetical protein NW760_014453 [Fusarium oxysporum]
MHSFKIILISLAPILAMPATSPRDINSDEPFDFGQGFLVPANLEGTLAPELGNITTEFDLDTRAPKETKVFFGKTQVDYGCDASIKEPLGEAIHSICGNGDCDKSVVYTRKVVHMAGGNRKKDAWLRIAVRGEYYGRHTRGYMASAVQQSVNPKTAVPATRYYLPTNPNFQAQKRKMSKFSNYINMRKNFGDTIYVEIDVTLQTSNSHRFIPNVLKEVAGALGGIGGSFFRYIVTAMIGC